MDNIKKLTSTMLTEREIIIYLLVDSGLSYRDLGKRLGLSYENIRNTYESSKEKMDKFAEAGFFSTAVK